MPVLTLETTSPVKVKADIGTFTPLALGAGGGMMRYEGYALRSLKFTYKPIMKR